VPAPHGGDELVGRGVSSSIGERLRDFTNRPGVLENRVIAGPVAEIHEMVVRVDDARNNSAAAQIDDPGTGRTRGHAATDRQKSTVSDRN
jgi:hypothetical protein